jgi:hypothetical protein
VGKRALAALLLAGAALLAAPTAGADPQDLVPYCSGDQTPMDSNCRSSSSQTFSDMPSGVSPDLPFGVNPGQQPVI